MTNELNKNHSKQVDKVVAYGTAGFRSR